MQTDPPLQFDLILFIPKAAPKRVPASNLFARALMLDLEAPAERGSDERSHVTVKTWMPRVGLPVACVQLAKLLGDPSADQLPVHNRRRWLKWKKAMKTMPKILAVCALLISCIPIDCKWEVGCNVCHCW